MSNKCSNLPDELGQGKAIPLGATITQDGVNFAIFSRNASAISIILFESAADDSLYKEYVLDRKQNKTGNIWHCFAKDLKEGACYLYRAFGHNMPEKGLRFNPKKALLDPYAKALTDLSDWDMQNQDISKMPRCIVINDDFDWQGDKPINNSLRFSIIYETHVKGLTANPNSNVKFPGTYKGVIEKIPYLKDLGITSIEFLPIQEFN